MSLPITFKTVNAFCENFNPSLSKSHVGINKYNSELFIRLRRNSLLRYTERAFLSWLALIIFRNHNSSTERLERHLEGRAKKNCCLPFKSLGETCVFTA